MNRKPYSHIIHLLYILPLLVVFSGDVAARKKDQTKASGAIDAKTFEVLTKAQELTEAEQYDEAVATLDKIRDSDKLNSYAKSQMWNFYAFIYASQEKYPEAINAYQLILEEADAPEGLKLTAKYTLAQLYFQLEDYQSVINFMENWIKEIAKPTSTAHIMLAQAYYQLKSYDSSLRNLLEAEKIESNEGKKIKENWLRLKAAIYFEKKDTKNTINTYKQLLALYPRVSYMRQIAGLHGELGKDTKRLTTYEALYLGGHLQKETEVLNLAYMYLGQEVPYKAGRIIETEMSDGLVKETQKNIETLANAWAQANEHKKAIPTLEKAAMLSDKGMLYARLAGVHFDAGNFEDAAKAAKKADQKGGLKRKDSNQMLMGMALFNAKKYESALQSFRRAKAAKKSFSDARKWEKYTLSEIKRLKALEAGEFDLQERTKEALAADENNVEAIGGDLLNNRPDITNTENTDQEVKKADTEE